MCQFVGRLVGTRWPIVVCLVGGDGGGALLARTNVHSLSQSLALLHLTLAHTSPLNVDLNVSLLLLCLYSSQTCTTLHDLNQINTIV